MFAKSTLVTHNTKKDIEEVLAKDAEALAESLEFMMVETRPLGDARGWVRGACCYLRGEPTQITMERAIHVVRALKAQWMNHDLQARVLICSRVIEMLEGNNASTR